MVVGGEGESPKHLCLKHLCLKSQKFEHLYNNDLVLITAAQQLSRGTQTKQEEPAGLLSVKR